MQKYLQRCQELVTPGCSSEATDPSHSDESRIWRRKLQKDPYKDLCGFPDGDPSILKVTLPSSCWQQRRLDMYLPKMPPSPVSAILARPHMAQNLWGPCESCLLPHKSHSLPRHCPSTLWLLKSNNYHADIPHISLLFHVFPSKGKSGTYFFMIKVKS